MAEAATHLTQNGLPLVTCRQFVVSFPIPLRYRQQIAMRRSRLKKNSMGLTSKALSQGLNALKDTST